MCTLVIFGTIDIIIIEKEGGGQHQIYAWDQQTGIFVGQAKKESTFRSPVNVNRCRGVNTRPYKTLNLSVKKGIFSCTEYMVFSGSFLCALSYIAHIFKMRFNYIRRYKLSNPQRCCQAKWRHALVLNIDSYKTRQTATLLKLWFGHSIRKKHCHFVENHVGIMFTCLFQALSFCGKLYTCFWFCLVVFVHAMLKTLFASLLNMKVILWW